MNEGIVVTLIIRKEQIALLFAAGWWLLTAAASWKLFSKAGERGWKSLIPFVNGHTAYKIAWSAGVFWMNILFTAGMHIMAYLYGAYQIKAFLAVSFALGLMSAVVSILYCFKLARRFGKGFLFGLGLLLLNPVFILLLAFGQAEYLGGRRGGRD